MKNFSLFILLLFPVVAIAQITPGGNGSGAVSFTTYQPGLLSPLNTNKGAFVKIGKASTLDNIEGGTITLNACTGIPVITLYDCANDITCVSPTTLGSVTMGNVGQGVDGTINSSAIAAGDYLAWAAAGTCTSANVSAVAQLHTN